MLVTVKVFRMDLVQNISHGLTTPDDVQGGSIKLVQGNYLYYHYGCDKIDDRVNTATKSIDKYFKTNY